MKKHKLERRISVGIFLLACFGSARLDADELELNAEQMFARGVSRCLRITGDRAAIGLQRGRLYEDDGPAAGFSYQPNDEKLVPGVWIKKELMIPAPQTERATLLVGRGGDLAARINGKSVSLDTVGKVGNYWQAYRFPPDALRAGKNEFVLSGVGNVWIARDDEYAAGSLVRPKHPNRSSKSHDNGKTWNDMQLGAGNSVDGEYYVRVFLDQYREQGSLTLGVIDVGNLAEKPIGAPVTHVGPIRIEADVVSNSTAAIEIRARTGKSFVPSERTWSEWSDIKLVDGLIADPAGRYLQVELSFWTDDRRTSPRLKRLTISASPARPPDWTKELQIVHFDNPQVVRSSIPFRYEPFDRAELARLRSEYKLDEVVTGAESEFDVIKRLAAWSATRWQRMHLKESYPPYNALEILKPHEDGTPVGGFCQQYNVVFLQACESFGLVGRLVSIGPGNWTDKIRGGHETVEIWSNELRKWVYIDGNTAWYAVDRATREPLSLCELRQRQLAAFRGENHSPIEVIRLVETRYEWLDLQHWPPLVELRLIPRSNFLEQPLPVPLNQGMRGWFWTGHYVWTDEQEPARLLYSNRVSKRANFEWTLNQAHVVFEAAEPGILVTHIETRTPGFKQFLRQTGDETSAMQAVSEWKLQPGRNHLRIVPQNLAGRNGIPTTIELDWSPN